MPVILFEIFDSVAVITLNRPEKLNSFNREMALLLQQKLDACAEERSIRAVMLTGAGKAFSAGQDIAEVADPDGPGIEHILSEQFNPIILKIKSLQKPVVCAVNGIAAGAGANIALNCDITIASGSASFIQAFSKIGLIPDSGGTYILPRLIGLQKAMALTMLGEKMSAVEAEQTGMIYKVFADEDFAAEAMKIVSTLAQLPTKALALTKQAINRSADSNIEQQLQIEDELQRIAGSSRDFAEGIHAFLEKRKPIFTGE